MQSRANSFTVCPESPILFSIIRSLRVDGFRSIARELAKVRPDSLRGRRSLNDCPFHQNAGFEKLPTIETINKWMEMKLDIAWDFSLTTERWTAKPYETEDRHLVPVVIWDLQRTWIFSNSAIRDSDESSLREMSAEFLDISWIIGLSLAISLECQRWALWAPWFHPGWAHSDGEKCYPWLSAAYFWAIMDQLLLHQHEQGFALVSRPRTLI
jgi:hypothetical protein